MNDHLILFGLGTAADAYFRLGFCPAKVMIQSLEADADQDVWYFPFQAAGVSVTVNGDDGLRSLSTKGVTLVKFNDAPGSKPGSGGTPVALEMAEWYKANGIMIANSDPLANTKPYAVEVVRMEVPYVRAYHDGTTSNNLYLEDSSIDFIEAGVAGGQQWVVINVDNDNWCYVKKIEKPAGKEKYCRIITAKNAAGDATAAADFDTNDVCILMPKHVMQFTVTDLTAMT